MKFVEFPDVFPVFLKALDLPEFARPEFYLKSQKKSGWSRNTYLAALNEAYHHYQTRLTLETNVARSKYVREGKPFRTHEFNLSLGELTQNAQEGILTRESLDDLRHAIDLANKLGQPKKIYTAYEVLSFCERFLIFIKSEFINQATKTSLASYVAEKHREQGRSVEGIPEYILYRHTIISDAPILNFNKFRNEVRKLLLTSQNPKELVTILKPLRDYAAEIVNTWNNALSPIEQPFGKHERNKGKGIYEQRLLVFDADTLTVWNRNIFYDKDYYREPATTYVNRDFAQFAAGVANFISAEVLKEHVTAQLKEDLPDSFDELFLDNRLAQECYNMLRDKGLVDSNLSFKRGALKSAFCLWVRELGRGAEPLISHQNDKVYTDLLNKKFKGLNLDPSNFRTAMTKAKEKFQRHFKDSVSKLSQLSPNGKEGK